MEFDHDVVVIGSGFGGSVAALRLAEKGYRVHVFEAGRRFEDEDFARTSWDVRRYLWAPRLGLLRRPAHPPAARRASSWPAPASAAGRSTTPTPSTCRRRRSSATASGRDITDWQAELAPHYATAAADARRRHQPVRGPGRASSCATRPTTSGVGDTFRKTPVGVFFGEPGKRVPDPYFGGAGPGAHGLHRVRQLHGRLPGRRQEHPASRTTSRSPSAAASRSSRCARSTRVRPLDPARRAGYAVTTVRTGHRRVVPARRERTVTAGQVVFAAGAWGTQQLLHAMQAEPARCRGCPTGSGS